MSASSGRRTDRFALALLALFVAACGSETSRIEVPESFNVLSESFNEGERLSSKFTCDGADVSPSLGWEYGGGRAESFVVTMTDESADDFVHWVEYGIGGNVRNFPENSSPGSGGANDFGSTGYRGPCPPEGDAQHRYVFTVYALERTPDAPDELTLANVLQAIDCCVVAKGTVTVTYGR